MQPIWYHRGKLILAALGSVALGLLFLWLLLTDMELSGRAGLLQGTLGRYVITPVVLLASALLAWRTAAMAAGLLDALAVDDAGVMVTTMWRSLHIPWSDLVLARLIEKRTRYGTQYSFCFDRRSAGSVRLPVALTTLRRDAYRDTLIALGDEQYRRTHRPPHAATSAPATVARGFGRKGAFG